MSSRKKLLRGSVSAFALFATAGIAQAQTATPAAPAATQVAQTAPGAAPIEAEQIVVTGIRASLQKSLEVKRNADGFVDAVSAEDIGKLPDSSVADALQRIPGVQVAQQGQGGETDTVVIRGLPNVVTTLNGNETFSGIGRSFAFQNMPSTAVRTIEVYKTSDASLPLGGIAGYLQGHLRSSILLVFCGVVLVRMGRNLTRG